ncbi:MAG: polysaccharide biosynthesis/export family protein [Pyrinomonadaceae bacterium]
MKYNRGLNKITRYRPIYAVRVLLTLFLFGTFCAVFAQDPSETVQSKTSSNYRIGPGDTLKVEIFKHDELSLTGARVKNDGTITLKMLDIDVQAACLTETELASEVAEKFKKYLLNPQVYVAVEQFNSNPVAFIGAVNTPSRFDVRRPTRLLELLSYVNGPTKTAGNDIQIIRRLDLSQCDDKEMVAPKEGEGQEIISVSLEKILKGNDEANLYVRSGDIITIAEAEAPDVAYINGNVRVPREIPLNEPVTLTKAIAMAGGVSQGAKIKNIKITRQDEKTLAKTESFYNLEEINKGKQDDVVLRANDIVEIPGPKPPGLWEKIFNPLVRTATRGLVPIPIY